jgi:hypothetical protein
MQTIFREVRSLGYIKTVRYVYSAKPNARRYNWATLFPGEINTGTWPSRLVESQNRLCSSVLWDSDLGKATLAMPGEN